MNNLQNRNDIENQDDWHIHQLYTKFLQDYSGVNRGTNSRYCPNPRIIKNATDSLINILARSIVSSLLTEAFLNDEDVHSEQRILLLNKVVTFLELERDENRNLGYIVNITIEKVNMAIEKISKLRK